MAPGFREPLSATDASFLRIETEHEPQHVGSLSILEGAPLRDERGALDIDRLRRHVGSRLHRVPRLRQRIMEVPLSQGRPVWVDDDRFDLDYHVRLTALPRPGDDEQLSTLMSRLQSLPLDRRRPLWEMWLIDGLEGDEVGLIIKTHHALGDGIANVDLAMALVDVEPHPPAAERDPSDRSDVVWEPRPAPSSRDLLGDAIGRQLTRPLRVGRDALASAVRPRSLADAASNVVRTAASFSKRPPSAPWNVAVTPHRRWVHADVPFDLAAAIRERVDVTLNDVVLAACTGALRRFLLARGDDVEHRTLRAMVPVSKRGDDEHGDTLGNRISLIIVDLPVAESDPAVRLERLHETTRALKRDDGLMDGAQRIVELADAVPILATALTRFVSRSIPMNLVITNVPGPPIPLYLLGAKILRTYPYVEVIDGEGLTMAVVSYDGQLCFGVTSDRDVLADLDDLARAVEEEFEALLAALDDRVDDPTSVPFSAD
jgi:diacylglycerol O-acyltransferase / wax synthase